MPSVRGKNFFFGPRLSVPKHSIKKLKIVRTPFFLASVVAGLRPVPGPSMEVQRLIDKLLAAEEPEEGGVACLN